MELFKIPWGLAGTFIVTISLHTLIAASSPSINVALKTSFESAPYLIELLETAGDENATSYFPLLDRIAEGQFAMATTDRDLYERFIEVLQDDGHMADPQALSAYQLALSLRSAAPRVEAHYQYYQTAIEPSIQGEQSTSCPVWVFLNGFQYCSPSLERANGEVGIDTSSQELPFDRVLGNLSAPASILYADITSPTFGQFHKTLIRTAREGKTSYRIRHKKPLAGENTPIMVSGYGVELALKRTDYIVIDDRKEDDPEGRGKPTTEIKLEDEELADLKPLSTSELLTLGLKASSFIMQSENAFEMLIKLSQDFPKFTTSLAAHNTSTEFLDEHSHNRGLLLPAGYNVIWINGVQIIERQVDAFTLLDLLRRERRLVKSVKELGITGQQAIKLLSHSAVSMAKSTDEQQRFDWRDDTEGGKVIIWLNDIEKDKRYEGWPTELVTLLQRTFPGQLPSVRRDIFNLVVTIDLSDMGDVQLLVGQIQSFVKRKLPIRFGIVPLTKNSESIEQAKVVYHLLDSYGLAAALAYLEDLLGAKKTVSASKTSFEAAVKHRSLRPDGVASSLEQILDAHEYQERVQGSKKWLSRLSASTSIPPFFINGMAYPRNENWLQLMSNRVNMDLQTVQRAVFEGTIAPDAWVPNHFLSKALTRRNTLIIPENEGNLKLFDINKIYAEHQDILTRLPTLPVDTSESVGLWTHIVLVADLSTSHGQQLLSTASRFRGSEPGVELVIVHNSRYSEGLVELAKYMKARAFEPLESLDDLTKLQDDGPILRGKVDNSEEARQESLHFWTASKALVEAVGLQAGEQGILINGRLVGPIPPETEFLFEDFVQLLEYERTKRIIPAYIALQELGLSDKVVGPLAGAKVTSIIALSTISDVPEGIFEQAPTLRISTFDVWRSEHTAIEVGDAVTADISITAVVDPASEPAQRWIPILRVLSELEGVHLKLYLNPKEKLQELPVKRFYRYVLDSKPKFNNDGSLRSPGASFCGIPKEALLTVGMDVPPPWLVAPKLSVHDLDNIKLSNVKADIDAVYELENILIEGHSREVPEGAAPRGAQLVLRTERDPHFADTIIMANLGYFQFKANPGCYKIDLQAGRSSEIFKIDSVGPYGWNPVPGDEKTDVALMSFQGATLYPRLSRKPGQEEEDVLETKINGTKDYVSQGLKFAENLLGFGKGNKGEVVKSEQHAEINIFSVASGHLYERMLNIMMVSVMKHTRHTVKFWFIEQFLSPSFKEFIPFLAAEYGFQYEMVTYKWPHWLRAQSEKQREIWGYKILFLDVLFPLSLDKVIFVDADQIVRTDMIELVNYDLNGAPYGFTPMCDSRTEMEGFRFWKQGYWKGYLKGLPYHISALYVVDLRRFRQIAAGDRLRQQYHQLSADPGSLANLDQDLPNHMQMVIPIQSLSQEWLWCETWCSDESLKDAKTIDLCNNPLTKEPKLDRARRQVPEWTVYDDEIAAVDKRRKGLGNDGTATVVEPEKDRKSRSHEETPGSSHVVDEL